MEDTTSTAIEAHATDIVVQLIVTAERHCRRSIQHRHNSILDRKAKLIEEIRRRKEAEIKEEEERQARLKQERIDRLLADAAALRQAEDIRHYIRRVKDLCTQSEHSHDPEAIRNWEQWALCQADEIDPLVNGRFLESVGDPVE